MLPVKPPEKGGSANGSSNILLSKLNKHIDSIIVNFSSLIKIDYYEP